MFKKHFANSNLRFFSDFISTNAVKNHRLSLLLLMLFTLLLLPASMVAQTTNDQSETAYVVFNHDTGTLTFSYGAKPAEGAYDLNQNDGGYTPVWGKDSIAITKVVFEESFKQARPTTCLRWFKDCKNLKTIENLQYLNTSEVIQMNSMFKGCNNLTELDLSNFNTAKVTDMNNMFESCQNLTSLDLSSFNTAQVTNMSNMFEHCKELVSLDLSNFNTANVKSMKNMFDECEKLVSLDISNFNTEKVTNMDFMFSYCVKLETIYSDDFSDGSLLSSKNMFNRCLSLKGAIEYKNTNIKNISGASYKNGYFTKLVGKNGSEKIGAAGELLIAENLTLDDNKDFVANATFIAKTASYSRAMKEGTTWGTLCLPFEISLENQNFRAFKLLSADEGTGTVVLKEIEKTIAAGTPVIIKMNDGETNLSFTGVGKEIAIDVQNSNIVSGYQLQGLYTNKKFDKTDDANCYIVKGGKLMNPAKMLENSKVTKVASKPFRAYMLANSPAPASSANMFSIGISDSATAIDTLNTIANDKAEYYDLQGKRLNEPQKGINIVKRGGKTMKVIIK